MSPHDFFPEEQHSLPTIARALPSNRSGKPMAPSTLMRWITRGCQGPKGLKVYLEAVKRPYGWTTSLEAVKRFYAQLQPDLNQEPNLPRTPSKRDKESQDAAASLQASGW
jgi:hypothetical protein